MKQPRSFSSFWIVLFSAFAVALSGAVALGCLSNPGSGTPAKKIVHPDSGPIVIFTDDGAVTIDDAAGIVLPSDDAGIDGAPTFFPVGGQVFGLTGSGLVLQNNSGDTLSIPSDGAFVFPTLLPAGATYAVTVATQPTGPVQTCTVSGGQGILTGVVTGVVVSCSTQAYPLGGQVVGLATTDAGAPSTGLVLTNPMADGGLDELPISQNGSFAFSTLVPSGSAYDIAIASQPTFPAQTCTVSGGTGTVVSGAVNSAVVNCATNSYVVGGNIAGLSGQGLVLANGTNTATISANGSFAFSQPLVSGSTYTITVATQPTTPSQTCVVVDGTGIVKGGNIGTVGITCTTNSFSVGGNVSTLAGSGLVLASSTGETLAVAGNGAFTFKTPVASGAPFKVTVKTQPTSPWQVCTVTGGSGTVANGPVGNVAVSCTTSSFAVGGNASGVVGSGLSLSLNGGAGLAISGDGSFTFPAPVLSGASYSVKIAQQPSAPTQTCTLAKNTGTIAGAPVISVAVSCNTNTYTVGGSVLGLVGTGLTLTNNGGNALVIPSGASSFTFTAPVASGGGYSVKVSAEPGSPSQTCSVSGATGTVVSGAVTSVIVNCGTNSFTVGGTVSTLAGSGLVLANGTATAAVSSNGSFAFSTPVASGGAYDVTVKTQPTAPSQTCTVANPTGNVGSSNVISVAVTCTTNSFTVGGQVNGLLGSGLVLVDNLVDPLAVTANGSFTFKTAVLSGAHYGVTVSAEPTSPWQTCVPSSASGTVANGPISGVLVACTTNTYSVGGSVNGLAPGDSLSLTLNGGAPLTVSANTGFTFPAAVASGATFSVAVSAPPSAPSQSCSVANGTGTIAGAAFGNVTVSCTTSSFTVGGKVTGLTGTGLTLTNNGVDALTIPSGAASFTFPTAILSGNPYLVQIKTQPSGPTQQCSVTGQNGTVAGAAISSVQVNCNTSAFSVGGTVSQLAGSGLVLKNGTDTVAISGNGSFAFPTPVASGGTFAVAVQTQPSNPTQICAVAAGSGTITNANYGSVQVTCTTQAYSVSVKVSGLVGSGLVLADNGSNTLAVAANGSYTFSKNVLSGSPFAVTVSTPPTSPWQSCAVSANGSGNVGSGPVSGITVVCTTLSFTVGGNVYGLQGSGLTLTLDGGDTIAINSNGGFTFPGSLPSGTVYTVATGGQPSSPTQSCSVTANASATIQGSNVGGVQVSCSTTPFTISGQIIGLTGSGLVLTDDGGDAIAIPAGATSFVFPTQILSGSSYDVEVETPPSGPTQVCTPSANTGNVGAGDVGSVILDCSVSSFTLSGTINGLTGSGLQISDGAGDTLGVSGSSFSFALQSGTGYAIGFPAQPTTPWETCSVTSGVSSGTITSTDVSGIVVTCTPNTYTVSGSVSGLVGSGFELTDNAGHILSVAPPTFAPSTFSETLPSGTAFNFTAYSNPTTPWQTCTATAGGSGTVTNTDISKIVVTCTTNSYAVTVNLSGAYNSTYICDSSCPYMGNGSYTFPAVTSGTAYSIVVYNPAYQTCSVTSGNQSGTVGGAPVSVNIYCSPPQYPISVSLTQNCSSPLTFTDGYSTISNIPYTVNALTETFPSLTTGTYYALTASWSSGCTCDFGSTYITDGTPFSSGYLSGPVSVTVSCFDQIQ